MKNYQIILGLIFISISIFSCGLDEEDGYQGELNHKDNSYGFTHSYQWYYGPTTFSKGFNRIDLKLSNNQEQLGVDLCLFLSEKKLISGTYTYTDIQNPTDMSFYYGDLNFYGVYLHRIVEGTMEVELPKEDIYSIKIMGRLKEGNLFSATYEGEIEWIDSSY